MEKNNELAPFEGKGIRKVWHDEQWYFAIIDVIAILAETTSPRQYWTKVKNSLMNESQVQPFWLQLKMIAPDSKNRLTDCANTEGILRIAMSVPSPKAEPLRLWLAQVGAERIEETESPELSFERMAEVYRAKGHTEKWIKERIQSIATRNELTAEWKQRDIKEGQEYSILTATIAKGTFGLTPSEHSEFKGLGKQNLRDHMTRFELILTSLSEESTRFLAVRDNAQGFQENHDVAVKGGHIGGTARKNLERQLGESVVSSENNLGLKGGDKPDDIPEGDPPLV